MHFLVVEILVFDFIEEYKYSDGAIDGLTEIKTDKVNLHFRSGLKTFPEKCCKRQELCSYYFSLNCPTLYIQIRQDPYHRGIWDNGVANAPLEHTIKTLKTACTIIFFQCYFFNTISDHEVLNLHTTNFRHGI